MNKIIMCNGAYRSGSTWLFNVVLGLVKGSGVCGGEPESLGVDQRDGDSLIELRPNLLRNWWVLKSHVYLPQIPKKHVKYIRTTRNPWAILASHMHIKGLETLTDEQIKVFCEQISQSHSLTDMHKMRKDCLLIDYESVFLLPRETIDKVDRFIGTNASDAVKHYIHKDLIVEKVKTETGKLKKASSYTQWRPNHISDQFGAIGGWMNVLDEELIKRVESVGW